MLLKRYAALFLAITLISGCFGGVSVSAADSYFKTEALIEAEHGSFKSEIYTVSSPYASGGTYIVSKSAAIQSAEDIEIDEMSYMFNIEEKAEYRTLLRVYAPSSSSRQMFYRWDSGAWKTLTADTGSDFYWAELETQTFEAGTHKLQLCHAHTGVWIDAVYVTKDAELVLTAPEGTEPMPETSSAGMMYAQEQKYELVVPAEGIILEAEDAKLSTGVTVSVLKEASNGKIIIQSEAAQGGTANPGAKAEGTIIIEFTAGVEGTYTVWARMHAATTANDSYYAAINDGEYTSKSLLNIGEEFTWEKPFVNIKASEGEKVTLKMRPRESKWEVDQFVITPKASFMPSGVLSEISTEVQYLEPITALPPYNPPAGEHPRVFFRKSDIPELIEKLNHPENAYAKTQFDKIVENPIDVGTVYNNQKLDQIEAKAYYYALFGDKKVGREAIDAALKTGAWEGFGTDITFSSRYHGRSVMTLSIVYDWCYDLLTEEEKNSFIEICTGWALTMEIGWPPVEMGSLNGHGAEGELLKFQMSFAIAVYDERPDIWNFIGGRFYEDYVPERQWYQKAEIHHQGAQYGIARQVHCQFAHELITGMGAPSPYDPIALGNYLYSHTIYQRRPDGMQFMDGDMYDMEQMKYNHPSDNSLLLSVHLTKDPYLKDELIRVIRDGIKSGIQTEINLDVGVAQWLIFYEPEVETKSISNLPLSRYFGSPIGVMFARTGWEEGLNANTVVAEMKVQEYNFEGHDHRDAGSFQIYYKGPLATESGFYNEGGLYFGNDNHRGYTYATVAHNSILVMDPNEDPNHFHIRNDGGQKRRDPLIEVTYENMMKYPEEFNTGKVEGHEIDPQNPIEPDYTYLKGDIANAYSEKVSELKRSFMFLNLKNEEIPAAMIVFDKVSSSNPDFKKTWLLHGQDKPLIKGSRTEWVSSPFVNDYGEEYTGKMIADHLLPKNPAIEVVGSPEDGWNIVDGVDISHPTTSLDYEENTYRIEISESGKETTYFLNCMQVTDEGNTKYLTPELLENEKFYGVKISDRVVYFSKSGERVADKIELTSDGGKYKFTVCDAEKGTWKITADQEELTAEVTEDGGVLSFETSAKEISAERIGEEVTEKAEEIQLKNEKTIYVKIGSDLIGLPVPARIVNGKLIVPVSALLPRMEIERKKGFLKETFYDESQNIEVIVNDRLNFITVNGKRVEMTNPAFYEDGELMVELRAFAEAFNFKVHWDDLFGNVVLANDKIIFRRDMEGYAEVVKVSFDGGDITDGVLPENLTDGNIATAWSAQGKGRYIQFELDKETILENIEIVFNPSGNRTPEFEVQVSKDGETFETIYTGKGSPDANGVDWEVFKFNPRILVETKYIRYVANGSDKSLWNGVREIKFKIGVPLVSWETSERYANVISAVNDGGEVDAECYADNLIDNNGRTLWSAQGAGRYAQLELENTEAINGVSIVFNPQKNRTPKFEIQVSEDGENYTVVYTGAGDPNAEADTFETFDFGKTVNAKYVRYVGLGSNLSLWNGVKEVRILKAQ